MTTIRKILAGILLPGVIFLAFPAGADDGFDAELAAYSERATVEKYPDADTVLLLDDETVRYDEEGFSRTRDRYVCKILTEEGRRSMRTVSFPYNRYYQELDVREIALFRDGKKQHLDPAAVCRDESDAGDLAANIVDPDDRILRVTLPELQINDLLLFEYRLNDRRLRMPKSWHATRLLQDTDPIIEYRYTVDSPEKLPVVSSALRDPAPECVSHSSERKDGRIVQRWIARDVPQIFPESAMPGNRGEFCQRLLLSTIRDWKEISRWYYRLVRPHLDKTSDALKAKAAELCRGARNDAEKADALFRFVSQEIRYMGLTAETEAPGYEPHDVAYTFDRRTGVCRDKAALLVAMMESVGLKAHMVLFMVGSHKDPEVPDPSFNHAVTAWETAPGEYVLFDPTAENSREKLPVYDADSSYLVATEKGETLRRSPAPDPEKNRILISTVASIDAEDNLQAHVTIHPTGIFESIYRERFQGRTAGERKTALLVMIGGGAKDLDIDHLVVRPENTADTSTPVSIEFDLSHRESLPESSRCEVIPLPRFAETLGFRNFFSGVSDMETRRYPMQLASSCVIEERCTLAFPPILSIVSLPADSVFHHPVADWECGYRQEGHSLDYHAKLTVKQLRAAASEYPAIRTLRTKLLESDKVLPVCRIDVSREESADFAAYFPGLDSVVLSDDTDAELLPGNVYKSNRTIRRFILNKAGVETFSEYRVAYRPERTEISFSGKVTDPDGTVHLLTPDLINDVDDPSFAGAGRYAPGKIKVVNLPGVKTGATVELEIRRIDKALPFCFARHTFGNASPVIRARYTLSHDTSLFSKTAPSSRNMVLAEYKKNGKSFHVWTANNLPGVFIEKQHPPFFFFTDAAVFSCGKLKDYAQNLIAAMEKCVSEAGTLTAQTAAALKLESDLPKEEKLRLIRDWVDRNVRPAGPDLSRLLPGEFFPPDRTIADGYGNSADRAILIAALCRKANLEYDFLFSSPFGADDQSSRFLARYPGTDYTGVLVRCRDPQICLNDTGIYAVLGATKAEEKIVLDSRGTLRGLYPAPSFETGTRSRYRIFIRTDGSARINVEKNFSGNAYEMENQRFSTLTPAYVSRYFQLQASLFSPKAKIVGTPTTDFKKYPGVVSYTIDVPSFAAPIGSFLFFNLPGFQTLVDAFNAGVRRTTPFMTPHVDIRTDYRISLPENFAPAIPPDGWRELGFPGVFSFVAYSGIFGNEISISHRAFLKAGIIGTENANTIAEIYNRLTQPREWRILLERVRDHAEIAP